MLWNFSKERVQKLTYWKYFNQRLLDCDGWFAKDPEKLFMAQFIVELKQVNNDENQFVWHQKVGRSHNE